MNKEAKVRAKARLIVIGLLAVGVVVALAGCMGHWFTQTQTASLIIGDPVVGGGTGTILVSVTSMPNDGLASLAVKVGGLILPKAKVTNVKVTGLNGFTVLEPGYDSSTGNVVFVVCNANAGSVGGTVAKVTFSVTGTIASADITWNAAQLSLGSAQNTLITGWQLVTGKAYYAK